MDSFLGLLFSFNYGKLASCNWNIFNVMMWYEMHTRVFFNECSWSILKDVGIRSKIKSNLIFKRIIIKYEKLDLAPEITPCDLMGWSLAITLATTFALDFLKIKGYNCTIEVFYGSCNFVPELFVCSTWVVFSCNSHHFPSNFIQLITHDLQSLFICPNKLLNIYNLV